MGNPNYSFQDMLIKGPGKTIDGEKILQIGKDNDY